ncbi:LytR C-terminal domain-containing protein [Georgenia halophila]|uniref:LytR C-terminal domain-containing protein n=1 Tax=Georgenia halophila TaxID=620889 RepID=A0ABP8LAN7_9MICO
MTAPTSSSEARAARRRRVQQRQTVVFGGLVTILLVVALVAGAMWTGLLPSPLAREFSSAEPTDEPIVRPCLPEDATPMPLSSITANVYNGTDRPGLAGETSDALSVAGVLINQVANWPQGAYGGATQIVAGPLGVRAGYSLARVFPDAVVALESSREDKSVDVVLGAEYDGMLSEDEIANLDPDEQLVAPQDCEPVETPSPEASPEASPETSPEG